MQDTWSLDKYVLDKGVVFAGPPSTAPHRSFCIGVLFTETTVKIPPPRVAQKKPANLLITALLFKRNRKLRKCTFWGEKYVFQQFGNCRD